MRWQHKANIMRVFANLPFGNRLYKWSQKRFGRLRAAPMERLPTQIEMTRWLIEQDMTFEGAKFFEVGTGHIPLVPIGFFLSGVAQTITVDSHQRIDWGLTRDCLAWMVSHRSDVERLYADSVRRDVFSERFAVLKKWQDTPARFLKEAGIEYIAPMDAAHTNLPSQSMDCHFSATVLEHIQPAVLADIFTEAKRILKPTGTAMHFVDLSDHFQHQDKSIAQINFLKFSDSEWNQIAGNEFAYCNRLRASDYLKLFQRLGFAVKKIETSTDQESLNSLLNGFSIDPQFHTYANEELSVTTFRVMLHFEES
jgi:hypothetical protein